MSFDPTVNATTSTPFNPTDPKSGLIKTETVGSNYIRCKNLDERERIKKYWLDLLEQTGVSITYWSNGYSLDEHDFLYGEQPTSSFIGPRILTGFINYSENDAILTKFGIMSENSIELIMPISEFSRVWGSQVPNIGDIFQVQEEACDRPENQKPKIFQITAKADTINPSDLFGGHYVWKLPAKRFDFSYEKNAPDETPDKSDQVSDTDFFGIMTGSEQNKSPNKDYTDNVDDAAKEDTDNSIDDNDNVYGGYL